MFKFPYFGTRNIAPLSTGGNNYERISFINDHQRAQGNIIEITILKNGVVKKKYNVVKGLQYYSLVNSADGTVFIEFIWVADIIVIELDFVKEGNTAICNIMSILDINNQARFSPHTLAHGDYDSFKVTYFN